jgi:hypothetical protein
MLVKHSIFFIDGRIWQLWRRIMRKLVWTLWMEKEKEKAKMNIKLYRKTKVNKTKY